MSEWPAPPPASRLARHPWLTDANTWRLDWRGNEIAPHQTGVWSIGNGRVFAHAGLALPFNRLQGITGPTYHRLVVTLSLEAPQVVSEMAAE